MFEHHTTHTESESVMRSTQLVTGALAVVATSALVGLGATTADATPDPSKPGTGRERGVVLECSGTLGATPVRANLYENRTYGNYLEVLIGDGPHEKGRSTEVKRPIVSGTKVRVATRLAGKRVTISGTAKPTGKVERVHEVVEDAGLRITSNGTHKLLKARLDLVYGKRTAPLSCAPAFRFDLRVTKTSMVD